MPPNTVVVTRGPGKNWGNPWVVARDPVSGHWFVDGPGFTFAHYCGNEGGARLKAIDHFRRYAEGLDLSDLRGKNLACWCALDAPCHADVLLELANP